MRLDTIVLMQNMLKTPKIDLLLIPVYIKFTALVHIANQPTQYVWQFDCCEIFGDALDSGLVDEILRLLILIMRCEARALHSK